MQPHEVRQEMRELSAERRRLAAQVESLAGKSVPEQLLPYLGYDARRARLTLNTLRQSHWGKGIAEYEAWLAERLPKSGLAQLIPGGLELLPDIYAHMPAWQRSFEELQRPRNYRQLLQHLYDYLEWYVDPSQPVPRSRALQVLLGILLGCALLGPLIAAAVIGMTTGNVALQRAFWIGTLLIHGFNIFIQFAKPRIRRIERQMNPYSNMVALAEYLEPLLAPKDPPREIAPEELRAELPTASRVRE